MTVICVGCPLISIAVPFFRLPGNGGPWRLGPNNRDHTHSLFSFLWALGTTRSHCHVTHERGQRWVRVRERLYTPSTNCDPSTTHQQPHRPKGKQESRISNLLEVDIQEGGWRDAGCQRGGVYGQKVVQSELGLYSVENSVLSHTIHRCTEQKKPGKPGSQKHVSYWSMTGMIEVVTLQMLGI